MRHSESCECHSDDDNKPLAFDSIMGDLFQQLSPIICINELEKRFFRKNESAELGSRLLVL